MPVALALSGLHLADMDVIESNEAFAALACGVAKELGLILPNPTQPNPTLMGQALGHPIPSHPIGATGAILMVKAAHGLQRTGGRSALITMCIGGRQGIAMVIERVSQLAAHVLWETRLKIALCFEPSKGRLPVWRTSQMTRPARG